MASSVLKFCKPEVEAPPRSASISYISHSLVPNFLVTTVRQLCYTGTLVIGAPL